MKYTIELTEAQVQTLQIACEAFVRLGLGQYSQAIDFALTGKQLKGYDETVEDYLQQVKQKLLDLPWNVYHSIMSDKVSESVKIAHDLHEVIRHRLSWDRNPTGGSGVNYRAPFQVSKEELPQIKKID
jgi:hypothetical protein